MVSLAELEYRYGTIDETRIVITLAPDTVLTLFLDGSAVLESTKTIILYECCWELAC